MVSRSEELRQHAIPRTLKLTESPFDPMVRAVFPRMAVHVPRVVTPNVVTVAGVVATILAGTAVACAGLARHLLLVAAGLVFVNWVADTLDGVLARERRQTSRLGDFLDHVFDAVSVAALTVGPAFSGLVSPTLSLLLGVMILLCFAVTYKGEQATGVYELLKFGPTEVRFVVAGTFVAAFFFPGDLVTVAGHGLQVIDLASLTGITWSALYLAVLFSRYARRLQQLDR
jgi:phosphatidylglycerophosphate synthase